MAQIIIVEDDENIRTLMHDVLIDAGHTVQTAADGQEGLRSIRASGADLVITDIFMPEQDGFELIMELRRAYPQVKILAMSGDQLGPQFGSLQIAQQLGAHAILSKPFNPQQMIDLVAELLQSTD